MEPREEPGEEWQAGYRAGFEAGVVQTRATLETELAALRTRVGELEVKVVELVERAERPGAERPAQRAAKTSRNSSLPPSSDPPSAPRREPRHPTGRKRGGQKGHPGHQRRLLASDEIDQVIEHRPSICPKCKASLATGLPDASPPLRQQVWELPKVKPIVTEHRLHSVECPTCHAVVRASSPAAGDPEAAGLASVADLSTLPRSAFGVRATAFAGVLHGRFRLSLRETQDVLELLGLGVSLGAVVGMCKATSLALAESYSEIQRRVREEAVAYVDETSWCQASARPWVWTMRGTKATLFQVTAKRNSDALKTLLGDYQGTVISDRFGAYNCLDIDRRGLCWSHLKRDFQAFVDLGESTRPWGKRLLAVEQAVFREWHRFREGRLTRPELLEALGPIQADLRALLVKGLERRESAGFCQSLLKLWKALWTFAEREGVEPTNNSAEQALRPVVLWRKGCFGAVSDWGNRFVERILSLSATCRQQHLDLLDTVERALSSWRAANPPPLPA